MKGVKEGGENGKCKEKMESVKERGGENERCKGEGRR